MTINACVPCRSKCIQIAIGNGTFLKLCFDCRFTLAVCSKFKGVVSGRHAAFGNSDNRTSANPNLKRVAYSNGYATTHTATTDNQADNSNCCPSVSLFRTLPSALESFYSMPAPASPLFCTAGFDGVQVPVPERTAFNMTNAIRPERM